jgi:hypothetical protein
MGNFNYLDTEAVSVSRVSLSTVAALSGAAFTGAISATSITGSTGTFTSNAFSVGGSTFVVTGGGVGIGTSDPNGTLDVEGYSQILLNSGNVGIGTSAPAQKLSVNGTIQSTSGGFMFPDGSTQTTASSGGGAQTLISENVAGFTSQTWTINFTTGTYELFITGSNPSMNYPILLNFNSDTNPNDYPGTYCYYGTIGPTYGYRSSYDGLMVSGGDTVASVATSLIMIAQNFNNSVIVMTEYIQQNSILRGQQNQMWMGNTSFPTTMTLFMETGGWYGTFRLQKLN